MNRKNDIDYADVMMVILAGITSVPAFLLLAQAVITVGSSMQSALVATLL
jgi:hypothetical protein